MTEEGGTPAGLNWSDLDIGSRVGPLTYRIEPEMVRDYCRALPVETATYGAADDAIMPPAMLVTDYIPLLRGHLSLGWGLMARHTIRSLRAVRVGDVVTVDGEIVGKFVRKDRHYWTLAYRVRNAAGEVCVVNEVTCSVD